jgi:hypothetical protein
VLRQQALVVRAGVLAASIRVGQQSLPGKAALHGQRQSIDD